MVSIFRTKNIFELVFFGIGRVFGENQAAFGQGQEDIRGRVFHPELARESELALVVEGDGGHRKCRAAFTRKMDVEISQRTVCLVRARPQGGRPTAPLCKFVGGDKCALRQVFPFGERSGIQVC